MAIPLIAAHAEPGLQTQPAARDWTRAVLSEDELEELLALRYQEYLARRALQELFEAGAMQALEH